MIRVLYDDEAFSGQSVGGISRYFSEIISQLELKPEVSICLPFVATANEHIRTSPNFHGVALPGRFRFRGRRRLLRLANRPALARALSKGRFDLLHFTYYDTTILRRLEGKRFVITIHDLIPELEDQLDLVSRKRLLIARAHRIIAISQHTKTELVRWYDVNPDNVEVIYHGIGDSVIYSRRSESS